MSVKVWAQGSKGAEKQGRKILSPVPPRTLAPLPTIGATIIAFYLLGALFAPVLAPYDPSAYVGNPLERPSAVHWLGTNDVGQDILSELIYGARISLVVGVVAGMLTLTLATLVGMTAGYLGGKVDALSMRFVDTLMAIPHLPLMILVGVYLGASIFNLILLIALLGWMVPARIIRAQVLSLRSRSYIHSARLFGAGAGYVIFRHLIPAVAPILAATFVAQAGRAIGMEAGLAFLGLGDPTAKSWGLIMRYALNFGGIYFTSHWLWWLLPAALNISAIILGFTFLGVSLESRLDPRLKRHAATQILSHD
ncbi:MAG: ABC transporter permease [Chloroflexi bacterium]|nr:ABC transporter permease [Chloroflexota bacterium]